MKPAQMLANLRKRQMKTTCPDSKCPKHGLKLQGSYCPACGTKAIRLPLYPFAIYIKPGTFLGGCGLLSGTAVVLFLVFGLMVPGIRGCQQDNRQIELKVQAMPEQWEALYIAMKAAGSNSYDVLREATKADPNFPFITPEQMSIILDTCYGSDKTKAAPILMAKVKPND